MHPVYSDTHMPSVREWSHAFSGVLVRTRITSGMELKCYCGWSEFIDYHYHFGKYNVVKTEKTEINR